MWPNFIALSAFDLEFTVTAAFATDLLVGDPRWLPHPVRLIGKAADWLEAAITRLAGRGKLAGVAFTAVIVVGTWAAAVALVGLAASLSPLLGLLVEILLIYTALAARDLDVHSRRVFTALAAGNLPQARAHLAAIVGRDTEPLDEPEIVRAAVETVAENTVDGVVAPLVFAILGGAPAALAYKAVNTLDSMVGHLDVRYRSFGWASARLDDAANYLPARLARLLFPLAARVCRLDAAGSWRISWRDGQKTASPNAGISEAAVAGALGVQLGGTNFYDGQPVAGPHLGDARHPLEPRHILQTIRLMYVVSLLSLVIGLAGRMLAWHAW
ncbi:MAG TPA: adenosylcobinamide-phosphate synthase CbiB [Pirellulales bacterium]|jgi:adenosylcobinamide-phosphate synthase|nr:adenosylcobinamide-phosphate synthase CbiB [Pirellulales bacterium]